MHSAVCDVTATLIMRQVAFIETFEPTSLRSSSIGYKKTHRPMPSLRKLDQTKLKAVSAGDSSSLVFSPEHDHTKPSLTLVVKSIGSPIAPENESASLLRSLTAVSESVNT